MIFLEAASQLIANGPVIAVNALDMKYKAPPNQQDPDKDGLNHRDKCVKNAYQHKTLMNQDVELQYCFEHSGRTCCGARDASNIRTKMSVVRKKSSPRISDQCLTKTSRAYCSVCDADIGTAKNDGALCLSFCQEWFIACKNEYFDPYIENSQDVPFCRDDSLICSPIPDVAQSAEEFCQQMGFKVVLPPEQSPFDDTPPVLEQDQQTCYNGNSRQLRSEGKLTRTKSQRQETESQQYYDYLSQQVKASYALLRKMVKRSAIYKKTKMYYPYILGATVLYLAYLLFEAMYYNSGSRRKERYLNAAQQAKLRVDALQKRKQSQQFQQAAGSSSNSQSQQDQPQSPSVKDSTGNKDSSSKMQANDLKGTSVSKQRKNSVKAIMEQIKETRLRRQMEKNKQE